MKVSRFAKTFLFSAVASLSFAAVETYVYFKQVDPDYFSFRANRQNLTYAQGETAHLVVHPKAVALEPGQRLYFDLSSTLSQPLVLRRIGSLLTTTVDLTQIGNHTFTAKAYLENAQAVDDNLKAQEDVADKIERIDREFAGRGIPAPVQKEKGRLLALQGALSAQLTGLRTLVQEKNLTLVVQSDVPTLNFTLESQVIDEGTTGHVQVELTRPLDEALLVEYTISGTATGPGGPDVDHDLVSGSVLIPANAMTAEIPIEIMSDSLHEGTETVVVTLAANPTVNMGPRSVHTIVIRDMTPSHLSFEIERNGAPIYGILRLGSSHELGGKVSEFEIDFGDGSPLVHLTPEEFNTIGGIKHLFCPGTFTAKITPIGFEGERLPSVVQAFDLSGTMLPIPNVSINAVSGHPLKLEFDASLSTDVGGAIERYGWMFGEHGHWVWSENPVVEYEFPNEPGLYIVVLTLMDDKMGTRRTSMYVEVTDLGEARPASVPVAVANLDKVSATAPATFTFDASASFSVSGNPIVSYQWIFDDRQYDEVRLGATQTRTFRRPGVYGATLVLVDSMGNEASEYFKIFVDGGVATPASSDIVVDFYGGDGYIDNSPLSFRGLVDPNHRYWRLDSQSEEFQTGDYISFSADYPPEQNWETREIRLKAVDIYGNTHTATQEVTVGDEIYAPYAVLDFVDDFGDSSYEFEFDATGSMDTEEDTEIRWGFEDGSSWVDGLFSVYPTFKKYFSGRNGHFGAWIRLRSPGGLGSSAYEVINLADGQRPHASMQLSKAVGFLPLTVMGDASASTPGDDPIVEYFWDFQEGDNGIHYGLTTSHTYSGEAGLKRVRMFAVDSAGRISGNARQYIYLVDPNEVPPENESPVADIVISNQSGNLVEFDASGSTDDTEIVVYEWDFGDGETAVGFNDPMVSHTYANPGNYTVSLKVTDEHGANANTSIGAEILSILRAPERLGKNDLSEREARLDRKAAFEERKRRSRRFDSQGCSRDGKRIKCVNSVSLRNGGENEK